MRDANQNAQALARAFEFLRAGDLASAENSFREILVATNDSHAEAMHFLGLVMHQTNRSAEAIPLMLRAIDLMPNVAKFHANLAAVFQAIGNSDRAIADARSALKLDPTHVVTHYNLGLALRDSGQFEPAIASLNSAVSLKPDFAEAHESLGLILLKLGKVDESHEAFERAVQVAPSSSSAAMNLGSTALILGEVDRAIEWFAKAESLNLCAHVAGSNRIVALNYLPARSSDRLLRDAVDWSAQYAEPISRSVRPAKHPPHSPLRVGFVSPDFRLHSVATFFEPLLATLDQSKIQSYCYAHLPASDDVTRRIQSIAHAWRDITRISDEQATQQIRADGIDILIDLAGHTADSRLMIFARQSSPVQISYLGWQNTTGLRSMGYRITDVHLDPPGSTERFFTEKLIRLPQAVAVYQPPENAPAVSPLPATTKGFITFGSFAKLEKITDEIIAVWATILSRVPKSRLRLCARGLHSSRARERITRLFQSHGIEAARLDLVGGVSFSAYLADHSQVDLMLDTFPFNGHTTTCHGLWMGVPTVTLAGDRYASRMGLSVMTNLGLPQFIAHSSDDFVDRGEALANDLPNLAELRATLRDRMRNSALMDPPALARHFEQLLHAVIIQAE